MFDVVFLALTMLAGLSQLNLKISAEISSIHLRRDCSHLCFSHLSSSMFFLRLSLGFRCIPILAYHASIRKRAKVLYKQTISELDIRVGVCRGQQHGSNK
jgi:hypothetical protein